MATLVLNVKITVSVLMATTIHEHHVHSNNANLSRTLTRKDQVCRIRQSGLDCPFFVLFTKESVS